MKFSLAASAFLLALPALAAASVFPRTDSQCNTGSVQCCNSLQNPSSLTFPVTALFALLGIAVSGLTGEVGVGCVNIVGSTCSSGQPTCCTGNNYNGGGILGNVVLSCNSISL